MTAGPLHPDNFPAGRDRSLGKGHGTAALGPSDSSDSGSDLQGAPGLAQQGDGLGLDADLDSDTDRSGTGERGAADGDMGAADGADIAPDHIEYIPDADVVEGEKPPHRDGRH